MTTVTDDYHRPPADADLEDSDWHGHEVGPGEVPWWTRKTVVECDGGEAEGKEDPAEPPADQPADPPENGSKEEEKKESEEEPSSGSYFGAWIVLIAVVVALLLSAGLTYAKYAGAATPAVTVERLLAESTQTEISRGRRLNATFTPPYEAAVVLEFDSQGVTYDGVPLNETFIVLRTHLSGKSRGMTLKIMESDHWIDLVALALKREVRIISLTHDGREEPWFAWNDAGHLHDEYGAALRTVNDVNRLMVERGVTHILIDTTNYTRAETWKFQVMQE